MSLNCGIYILKFLIRRKLKILENEQTLKDSNNNKTLKNNELINYILNSNLQLSEFSQTMKNLIKNITSVNKNENESITFNSINNNDTRFFLICHRE